MHMQANVVLFIYLYIFSFIHSLCPFFFLNKKKKQQYLENQYNFGSISRPRIFNKEILILVYLSKMINVVALL